MKTIITIALTLTLAACAGAPQGPYNPIAAQCEYEADIAIAGIVNPIMAGVQKGQLMNRCMQIRSVAK